MEGPLDRCVGAIKRRPRASSISLESWAEVEFSFFTFDQKGKAENRS
jgi:hypothetical protein